MKKVVFSIVVVAVCLGAQAQAQTKEEKAKKLRSVESTVTVYRQDGTIDKTVTDKKTYGCDTCPGARKVTTHKSKPRAPQPVAPIKVEPIKVNVTVNPVDVNVHLDLTGWTPPAAKPSLRSMAAVNTESVAPASPCDVMKFKAPRRVWKGDSAILTFKTPDDGVYDIKGATIRCGLPNIVTISSDTNAVTSAIFRKTRFTLNWTDSVTGFACTKSIMIKRRRTFWHYAWIYGGSLVTTSTAIYFGTGANHHDHSSGGGSNPANTGGKGFQPGISLRLHH